MVKSDRCKKNMIVNHKNKEQNITSSPTKSRKKDPLILWRFLLHCLMSPHFEPYIRWTGNELEWIIVDGRVVFTEFKKIKWERKDPTSKNKDPGIRWKDCLITKEAATNGLRGLSSQYYITQANKSDNKPLIKKIRGLIGGYRFITLECIHKRLSMSYEEIKQYAQNVGSRYENVNLLRIKDGKASSKKRNNKLKPTTPVNVQPIDLPVSSSPIQMTCYGAKEVQYQGLGCNVQLSEYFLMDRTCSQSLPDSEASALSSIASQEPMHHSVVNSHHIWSNSHDLENADMETMIQETAADEAPMIYDKTIYESLVFEREKPHNELLYSQRNTAKPAVVYPNNFGNFFNNLDTNMNAHDVSITDPPHTYDISRIDAYPHQVPTVNPHYFENIPEYPEYGLTNDVSPPLWSQLTPSYTQPVFDPSNMENPENERFPSSYKASLEADQFRQLNPPNLNGRTSNFDFSPSSAAENSGETRNEFLDYCFRMIYKSKI